MPTSRMRFSEMCQRHGAAETIEVTWQTVDWQRQAAHDLARDASWRRSMFPTGPAAINWTEKTEGCPPRPGRDLDARCARAARGAPVRVFLHQPRCGRA
jgi:hypothetical protein